MKKKKKNWHSLCALQSMFWQLWLNAIAMVGKVSTTTLLHASFFTSLLFPSVSFQISLSSFSFSLIYPLILLFNQNHHISSFILFSSASAHKIIQATFLKLNKRERWKEKDDKRVANEKKIQS